ncbi:MAG: alpha/beta hydrolase, partial [Verrucomicrobiales bacterium]|nr:alpha/beta hydrolase [Verrucomicrobiales bacterium]
LAAAGRRPPYLLVGYSFGGPYTRVFADLYPSDVAGLVLVDPTQEAFIAWLRRCVPWFNVVTGEDRARQNEWGSQVESMQQASAARLPEVPLTLITATATPDVLRRNLVPRVLDAHTRWLSSYPGARHVLATNSDHGIVLTHPEIVTEEIRSMVTRIRDAQAGSLTDGTGRPP